ncbi:hypothetical protein [Hydrogenophaga sp. 5NK40-0174]|uniref:hypothetical protein n=1 Tax=Hydrogenophaga sp. 5NK40-0174 TaxID=3127649 RepID=UPI003106FF82
MFKGIKGVVIGLVLAGLVVWWWSGMAPSQPSGLETPHEAMKTVNEAAMKKDLPTVVSGIDHEKLAQSIRLFLIDDLKAEFLNRRHGKSREQKRRLDELRDQILEDELEGTWRTAMDAGSLRLMVRTGYVPVKLSPDSAHFEKLLAESADRDWSSNFRWIVRRSGEDQFFATPDPMGPLFPYASWAMVGFQLNESEAGDWKISGVVRLR